MPRENFEFMKTTYQFFELLAEPKTQHAINTLAILIQGMKYKRKNIVYVTQGELAEMANTTQATVSRQLKTLIKAGAVKRCKRAYMVNPSLAFIGSAEENKQTQAIWDKLD